jgi:hypothetical protein
MKSKIILITQYYKQNKNIDYIQNYQVKRQKEIDVCLIKNAENELINEIHLLVEEIYDLSFISEYARKKIIQININKRLTFKDVFDYYNNHLSNEICILQNSDIYTDSTLNILHHINFSMNCVLCMNRYEINSENNDAYLLNGLEYNHKLGHYTPYLDEYQPSIWSQDVWIWKCNYINIPESDFNLGIIGCDNYIAYLFSKNGYTILNPSKLISFFHNDLLSITYSEFGIEKGTISNIREQRIKTPDEYLFLDNIDDIPDKYTKSMKNVLIKKKYVNNITTIELEKTCHELILKSYQIIVSNITIRNGYLKCTSDQNPIINYIFDNEYRIVIIDIFANMLDRYNKKKESVAKFRIEYFRNDSRVRVNTYTGNINNAGNLIKRIYLDVPISCNKITIIPIEYNSESTIKFRFFKL